MLPTIAVAAIGLPIAAIFIHKAGLANISRNVGLRFLAFGDAIEHYGNRYTVLSEGLRQNRAAQNQGKA